MHASSIHTRGPTLPLPEAVLQSLCFQGQLETVRKSSTYVLYVHEDLPMYAAHAFSRLTKKSGHGKMHAWVSDCPAAPPRPTHRCPGASRNTAFHELMLKKNEQIYKLLAICIAMCASVERWLDDAVKENLRKKCADDLLQMQSGSMEHFKKVFSYGCPKFVTALPPDLSEERVDNSLAGFHAARQRFMAEVRSRLAPLPPRAAADARAACPFHRRLLPQSS